ncbi:hypothetical protein [Cellulomonas taurus]|uniref:hypothetical protein n=1 Tax=Cellulomonas taurus TaxID=2729175 RepID=UPI00145E1440|nr:hypothetical protein [Cellulomonas taurus]
MKQPWAWAIIHGQKDVENRVQSLGRYRGPVAIHAGASFAPEAWRSPVLAEVARRFGISRETAVGLDLPTRCVIGVVDLVDEHRGHNSEMDRLRAVRSCFRPGVPYGPCSPWAMSDHHHLVLANPRPLPRPIPATGRLGLWRPDDALLAATREQLREVA